MSVRVLVSKVVKLTHTSKGEQYVQTNFTASRRI